MLSSPWDIQVSSPLNKKTNYGLILYLIVFFVVVVVVYDAIMCTVVIVIPSKTMLLLRQGNLRSWSNFLLPSIVLDNIFVNVSFYYID